jgi:hypothetical protein
MLGEHIKQHHRTMRLARSAVSALVVLTVAALVAAYIAKGQRDATRAQTVRATPA